MIASDQFTAILLVTTDLIVCSMSLCDITPCFRMLKKKKINFRTLLLSQVCCDLMFLVSTFVFVFFFSLCSMYIMRKLDFRVT